MFRLAFGVRKASVNDMCCAWVAWKVIELFTHIVFGDHSLQPWFLFVAWWVFRRMGWTSYIACSNNLLLGICTNIL